MQLKRFCAALLLACAPVITQAQAQQPQMPAEGQGPANKTQALLMAMAANSKSMAAYQWKQKTTVVRSGDELEPTIEQLHFDATGTLQRTVISKPEEKHVRGLIRKKKVAEVKESIQEIMQLVARYTNPQQLKTAIMKGEMWQGEGASAGTIKVNSNSVVSPGDQMAMIVDAATFLPSSIEFKTQHEGHPLSIRIDYRQIPNGPSMMNIMRVSVPEESLAINVESFDFMRLAAAATATTSPQVFAAKAEPVARSAQSVPRPTGWPREFSTSGARLVVYQPQLKMWQKFQVLTADTAVSVQRPGSKPMLGVVSWRANTVADMETRMVAVRDVELISARFPSLDPVAAAAAEAMVRQAYPAAPMTISLDRLLAGLEPSRVGVRQITANPEPPTIFVSYRPAILLFVDGEPIRVPIEGTQLEFVVNTNWDIFYDKSHYYLLNQTSWLKAKELKGPWMAADMLPADMAKLPASQNWDDVKRALPLMASSKPSPAVFYATRPAELISFNGQPAYERIAGTMLADAANTKTDVFLDGSDSRVYVLISGRWFRAPKLEGPWSYAGNDLPADFAKILNSHRRSHVLAAVPGTQQANDAVLLAQIPVSAVVNRSEAEKLAKVTYAGQPQFQAIENTSLQYAVNTQEKVIKFGDLYYLCLQGVWFISTTPNGPWKTADSIPAEIYSIPPSSPVHNVTYVTISNPTTTTVEYSYTSGYTGVFVVASSGHSTVVYGTGYYYPPYVYYGVYPYPVYYPCPYTYGIGAVYSTTYGTYGVGQAVYGPYGAAGRAAWYNPSTGTYGRGASVQTVYGGRTAGATYNPWTGTATATRQGSNAYGQWGSSVAVRGDDWVQTQHATNSQGTAARFQTSSGASGTAVKGAGGNTAYAGKDANNNLYAGNDGNLYKKDASGNWSKYDNGSWSQVDSSAAKQQAQQRAPQSAQSKAQPAQNAAGMQLQAPSATSRESLQQQAQANGITRESAQQSWQNRQAGGSGNLAQGSGSRPSVSSDTWQQLNRDASARQSGAFRERARAAGGGRFGPR